jgi:hypothetical protein
MKARLAVIVAASFCIVAGPPALAQQTQNTTTTTSTPTPTPTQNELVGPPQLRDFTLNGTVTRPAPAPTEERPAPQTRQPARSIPAPATEPRNGPAAETPGQPSSRPAPEVDASDLPPETAPVFETPPPAPTGIEPPPSSPAATPPAPSTVPMLPWILAGFALAGAVAWFFLRQRRRPHERLAGGPTIDLFDHPEPAVSAAAPAAPRAVEPAPAPQPQPAPAGIVSTRLRPWLEIEFNPDRAVVDEQKAAVAFELTVFNSGNGPARDVVIEASLFNAGPMQDQEIRLFFENPVGRGDKIPVIPPMKRITVNTAVFLARDQVRPIEIEGRALFVPMVAFNALYSWGAKKAQTSTSYLVGKETQGEKLAPFRLDLGPRIFRGLAARQHEVQVRT